MLILGTALALHASAQIQPATLVTQPIDESRLVTLQGTVHPLAQSQNDRGPVADSFTAPRLLLLLNRPPEREAALRQYLQDVHTPGSAIYHQWITPREFGARFGPAGSDIEAASAWLTAHGFQVARISPGRQFLEFSGTAGALRSAFHAEIHRYEIDGKTHYANSAELKIPAALANLIQGVSPLNDFRAQPQIEIEGQGTIPRGLRPAAPQWTSPNQYGTSNPYEFTVAPEDLQTQYDLAPLYQAGVTGAGQTIGIINESNIDLSLVQDFQSLFGTGGTTPQVIVDGDDPGEVNGVNVEAYLDVELSGAVAPKATVDLYIASAGALVDPLELAALRAVDDNQASVLSVSFGQCEYYLGNTGNQLWAGLWEQAGAQGQTVLVSSGDTGPDCANSYPQVNGLASTPWNVAVGGTDFYYSDYATGGASASTLWNTANDANLGSLKAPLPEQPWDDPFGFNVIADSIQRNEDDAGGGSASNCVAQNPGANSQNPCLAGYPKPAWQSGPGVPADNARDLPDISLFASNGANLSAYAICAFAGQCAAGSGASAQVELVGGTSASAPEMAGILALVNQKFGRQGQAGFVLYPLAQQKPSAFHDIAIGSNSVPCGSLVNANCVQQANGYNGTPLYPAGPGYDMATGLGSIDASLLVNGWNAVTFQPTSTTLRLSSNSITHGSPVTVTASVAPSSGSGTPTGDVAVLSSADLPASQSQLFFTLSGGTGSGAVNYLPGGEYELTGRYGGDGIFAASTSQPVPLTVAPEASKINFSMTSGTSTVSAGAPVSYGNQFQLNAQPSGATQAPGKSDGVATGSVAFTLDSTSAAVALNSAGVASFVPPALSVGNHTAGATYAGDASFKPSSSTPVAFSIEPGMVFINDSVVGPYTYQLGPTGEIEPDLFMATGSTLQVGVSVQGFSTFGASPAQVPAGTAAPSGTVEVCLVTYDNLGNVCSYEVAYSQTVPLSALSGAYGYESLALATFPNLAANYYNVTVSYQGDPNWMSEGLQDLRTITVETLPALAPSTTALSISPGNISGVQTATITVTVTGPGNGANSPAGEVDFFDNDVFLTYWPNLPSIVGSASTVSFEVSPAWFLNNGPNTLTAVYRGDGANGPSLSNVVNFTSTRAGDFTLAPQSPLIAVKAGGSATVALNLASVSSFNGSVGLSCTPSSTQFSCAVDPGSLTVNGPATATVTVTAMIPVSPQAAASRKSPARWPIPAGALAFCLLCIRRGRRALSRSAVLSLLLFAALSFAGCGGGGSTSTGTAQPPPGSTPAGTYCLVVTGTANGIVHNAKIAVAVQ